MNEWFKDRSSVLRNSNEYQIECDFFFQSNNLVILNDVYLLKEETDSLKLAFRPYINRNIFKIKM